MEDRLSALGRSEGFDTDGTTGLSAFAGYRIHRFFAAEVEFEKMAEVGAGTLFGEVVDLETWALTANLKVLPLTGRIQPFVLIGFGVLHVELDDERDLVSGKDAEYATRFGAGLDVYLSEHIVVFARGSYLLPTGDLDAFDYLSFGGGIQFRF